MSRWDIVGVLARWPDVSYAGFGRAPDRESPKGRAHRRQQALDELLDPVVLRQYEIAAEFIDALGGEDRDGDLASSHELKRLLERWWYARGEQVYVCHSMIIIAALAAGFMPRQLTPPSCSFSLSPMVLMRLRRASASDAAPSRDRAAFR